MERPTWKILMIDDDEDDYVLTRQMLAEAKHGKYLLDWASTYEEGWRKIQTSSCDAVLMDYDLGSKNGLDLIRLAVANSCHFPIILYTGRGSYEVDLQAMQAGAALYLTKSEVNPLLLERGIRYAIERKQNERALASANEALAEANALLFKQKQELDRRLQERSHILESIQDSFFSIDWDWTITYMNRKAALYGGTEPEQVIGKNFWEAFPKVKGTWIEQQYRRAMDERIPVQFETPGVYQKLIYSVNIYPSVEGISVFSQDISERKRAEEALEDSRQEQARLASFPELNPNPILEIDLSGSIRYLNPHGQKLFPDLQEKGVSHAFLIGWEDIREQLRKEPGIHLVREIQVGDHYYQQSIYLYAEYQLIRIYGMDISTRMQAEKRLRERERQQRELAKSLEADRAKLAAVLDNLPVGVWIADETGRLTEKNKQADRIWAGEAPLAEGVNHYNDYAVWFVDSGKEPLPEEYPMVQALRTGQPAGPVEFNIRRFDGSGGTILVSAAPIQDREGFLMGAVGINIDITERKQVEEARLASEAKYRKLFDNISESFVLFEVIGGDSGQPVDFRYVEVNPAFEKAAGLPRETFLGRTLLTVFPSTSPVEFECLRQVAQSGQQESIELFRPTLKKWFREYIYAPVTGFVAEILWDITERKQAEVALQDSEARLRALIAASAQVIYTMNPDWREMRQLQGGSFLADMEKPNYNWLQEYIHPDDQQWVGEVIENAVRTGTVFELEHRVLKADGSLGWTASRAVPVRNAEGAVVEWFGTASDISERKRVEAERERLLEENRQQRAFLERLIQAVPVAIAVLQGPEHRYTITNPHQDYLSRGKGKLLGRTVAEVWSEGPEQVLPILDRVYQTGEPFSAQDTPFLIIRDHGPEVAYFDVSYVPLCDQQDHVAGILALAVETTGQVAVRKALEAEQARLLAIINSAPAGIVVTDEQARILMTNELANQLYARPVPIGQDFASHAELQICKPDGIPYEPRNLPLTRSTLDGETYNNLEMLIVWPDGQRRPLLVNTAPIQDVQGRVSGAVGVFQDISRLKQAEADLERYARQLEQSNRELQDFAFIASHDMQEPLRKIVSFAERLQQKTGAKLDVEEGDYLKRMGHAAERMASMLAGLLDYSRVATKAQPNSSVDLAHVVMEVLQDLDLQIESSKGQVEVGELPVIEAEPTQMRQLLQNLIGNAVKFSQPGIPPQVKVFSRIFEGQSPGKPQMVEIRVEDNGIGFDPEAAQGLFLPFHRLVGRSQDEGNGMGLAICRKIVERHAGTITAQTQPGQGATMIVRLPVKQASHIKAKLGV